MQPPPTEVLLRDAQDPLAGARERFHLPEGLIYLDGNSLGPAPVGVFRELQHAVAEEWAGDLIASWNDAGWFALPRTLGARLAPLIGAAADTVLVCDTVSINLFKCLHAALALRPERRVIVAEQAGFPTDLYIVSGIVGTRPDLAMRLQGRDGATLEELIGGDTAVVLVNHVDYRTGALRDMAALTARAHEAGALILWDLCHSAGILPVALEAAGADFAVGCGYKYLNGGPGAPAFAYVRPDLAAQVQPALSGWLGHQAPFAFAAGYAPAPGIDRLRVGTPPVLSLAALDAALDAFDGVSLDELWSKGQALAALFLETVEAHAPPGALRLASPRDPAMRGSQIAFHCASGYAVMQQLISEGVIGDFRDPDIIRFGFAPLYLRFAEVEAAARRLGDILATRRWDRAENHARAAVT